MALEWVVLGYTAAAKANMILLLTLLGLHSFRKGMIAITTNLLKPFISVVVTPRPR
ncbi:putative B-cell receptor-associated protein [Helianthus anomalus]